MASKRVFGAIFALFYLFLSVPSARAVDIPLLTWERGKEQNIVLGGTGIPTAWTIRMSGAAAPQLTFVRSAVNTKGFVVFSTQIPSDYPLGSYTVKVYGQGSSEGSIVAGVNIVALAHYSISQVPSDLKWVVLAITFIVTGLSVIRSKKYQRISYLSESSLVDNGTLTHDRRFPSILYRLYILRDKSLNSGSRSLFWFLARRDSSFLHKVSPVLWALSPVIGGLLGLLAGFSTGNRIPSVGFGWLLGIAVIGLVDALAGFFGLFAFVTAQIILGNVTSLRSILVLLAFGLGWVITGILIDLFHGASNVDVDHIREKNFRDLLLGLYRIIASLAAGSFFYFTQVLANSLTPTARNNESGVIVASTIVGLAYLAKDYWSRYLDRRLISTESNISQESYDIVAVVHPQVVLALAVTFASIAYLWSGKWNIAITTAVILTVPFVLLLVRFSKPRLRFLSRWARNVYLEAGIVAAFSLFILNVVATRPLAVAQKSELILLLGFLPALLHAGLSSLYDVTGSREVVESS